MTAREHDPALVERVSQMLYDEFDYVFDVTGVALSDFHAAASAILDAVADDIARAERERVLDKVQMSLSLLIPRAKRMPDGENWVPLAEVIALRDRLRGGAS